MNQTELPIIEVDYDVAHRLDEEKCNKCDKRFRCWASRGGARMRISMGQHSSESRYTLRSK